MRGRFSGIRRYSHGHMKDPRGKEPTFHMALRRFIVLLFCAYLLQPNAAIAEQVTVRQREGLSHGFLALRTLEGKLLADGEIKQVSEGDRITNHLIFRFKDGSIYEDTVTFSQRGRFRLLIDHLVQQGPSFNLPMDISLDATTAGITVRHTDDDGKEKTINERLDLPAD